MKHILIYVALFILGGLSIYAFWLVRDTNQFLENWDPKSDFSREENPDNKEYSSVYNVPERVSLFFTRSLDENKYQLELSTHVGGGCDRVSSLYTEKVSSGNDIDVSILGYDIDRYQGGGGCPAVVSEARTSVDITHLVENGLGSITFTLDNQKNRYVVTRDEYAIYFKPTDGVSNVISYRPGYNQPVEPQTFVKVRPDMKVGEVSMQGAMVPGYDYKEDLKIIAERNGLLPFVNVLEGFKDSEEVSDKTSLLVFIPNGVSLGNDTLLDTIPSDPMSDRDMETADVILYLSVNSGFIEYSY